MPLIAMVTEAGYRFTVRYASVETIYPAACDNVERLCFDGVWPGRNAQHSLLHRNTYRCADRRTRVFGGNAGTMVGRRAGDEGGVVHGVAYRMITAAL